MLGPNQVKNVDTGEVISFERAKELGVAEVETSEGSERPTFSDAVRRGLVDFQRGVYTDVVRGMTMPISEAILEGLLEQDRVEPAQPGKYTIIQVFELYYDEVIFLFRVPNVSQPLTFEQLLERGYLDLNAVIYDMSEGVIMTTEEAIESGHIDTKTGKLRREGQEPVSIKDAIRAGLLVAIEAPLLATLKGTERLRRMPPARSPVEKPQDSTKGRSPSPPKVTSPKKAPGETPRASEDGQPAKAKPPVERSPSREVKEPGPPTRPPRTTHSPGKDTREKSPTKEAPTKAPTKEVPSRVPKSPTKEAPVKPTEKVLTKEGPTKPTDKAPTKEV
ncbi:unnamed protein product, partial [Ixodes persulcatus]